MPDDYIFPHENRQGLGCAAGIVGILGLSADFIYRLYQSNHPELPSPGYALCGLDFLLGAGIVYAVHVWSPHKNYIDGKFTEVLDHIDKKA